MKFRNIVLLMLLVLVASVIAACGGDDDDNGNGGGGESSSLSQSFNEAGLSFNYPEGWVSSAQEEGYYFANSQAMIDQLNAGSDGQIPDGGQGFTVLPFPAPEAVFNPQQVFDLFSGEGADEEGVTVGESEEVTIGEYTGVTGTISDSASGSDGVLYVMRVDPENIIAFIAVASEGDLDAGLMRSIVETVRYTAPATEG